MNFKIVLELLSDVTFITMVAYLIGRSGYVMNCARKPEHPLSRFTLIVLFSFLSIIGTYNALPLEESLGATRLTSILLGGILGGPVVGLGVGIISSIHLAVLGGPAVVSYTISSILAGYYAGIIRNHRSIYQVSWDMGAGIAVGAEIAQNSLILILSPVFGAAANQPYYVVIPTAAITVLCVSVFLFIIGLIEREQDVYGAKAAQLSLAIASRTLPYLRQGLTTDSAEVTAQIIYDLARVDAVSITNTEHTIAAVGVGQDVENHQTGELITDPAVKKVIDDAAILVSIPEGQEYSGDNLSSEVIAPLIANNAVIGTVKLARIGSKKISELDTRIADGIANLLSVQIELADADLQKKLREKAELIALRAQINPHFLFNTISIIMSFCRTDPDKARNLLGNLATIMQRSFANQDDFVALSDELAGVKAYIEIAKSRFGARLEVRMNVDKRALSLPVPVLIIQPLVENAIQHGLFPKLDNCVLTIDVLLEDELLKIIISDNGVGIPPEKLRNIWSLHTKRIGLRNVNSRLISIYGPEHGLNITSSLGEGTQFSICIPLVRTEKDGTESDECENDSGNR